MNKFVDDVGTFSFRVLVVPKADLTIGRAVELGYCLCDAPGQFLVLRIGKIVFRIMNRGILCAEQFDIMTNYIFAPVLLDAQVEVVTNARSVFSLAVNVGINAKRKSRKSEREHHNEFVHVHASIVSSDLADGLRNGLVDDPFQRLRRNQREDGFLRVREDLRPLVRSDDTPAVSFWIQRMRDRDQ